MFSPLPGSGGKAARRRATAKDAWHAVVPVPEDAPPPPDHYKLGAPSARYAYHGPDGCPWGYVCRFETADGGKDFLPLTFCRRGAAGAGAGAADGEWRWKGFDVPRPLYGLDRLASDAGAPVVVCEGEKAKDAAGALLPDWVAVTSPGGSNAAAKADWAPLTGRRVVVWPDADGPGLKYADAVAKALAAVGAGSVAVAAPLEDAGEGWDAADAASEEWATQRVVALLEAARPVGAGGPDADGTGHGEITKNGAVSGERKRTGPPQRDNLIDLVEGAELWHSPDGDAFTTVPFKGHLENRRVRSRGFKVWLAGQHYEVRKTAAGGTAARCTWTWAPRTGGQSR